MWQMDETKEQQRHTALLRRHSMTPQQREKASAVICRKLLELPEFRQAKVIMSYAAMPDEPDLSQVHEWLWQQSKTLAFPVTEGKGSMYAVSTSRDTPWRQGRYGIREPMGEVLDPAEIDLVIAPCVAFDRNCHRLGHGGGYYDRFLPKCPQATCVVAAFAVQCLDEISIDGFDHSADMIVTEDNIYENQ